MASVIEKAIRHAAVELAKRKGLITAGDEKAEKGVADNALNKARGIDRNYPDKGLLIVYDSFLEGLEPIYFTILDMMRDNYWGLGLDVSKTLDEFEASVGGGFFGDIGTRASVMQDRAMKHAQTIGIIVKSVLNIIYDLKDFEIRLDIYDKLKSRDRNEREAGMLSLKTLWMDKVDIQKGTGSINMLVQKLGFVTLRDAFMKISSLEEADKVELNDRVMRILKQRFAEFETWLKMSEEELRRRYRIERLYLKSQIESLKLYAQWAKPYFIAAQKLQMASFNSPDLVNLFDNMKMEVNLLGKKEIASPIEGAENPKKFYACIEVQFSFRSVPHVGKSAQGGMHYAQGGRVEIRFIGYGLDEYQLKTIEDVHLKEGLSMIAGITDETINEIIDAAKRYTEEKPEIFDYRERLTFLEELEKTSSEPGVRKMIKKHISEMKKPGSNPEYANPFGAFFSGIADLLSPLAKLGLKKPKMQINYIEEATKKASREAAGKFAFLAYNLFKKQKRMLSWG